MITPDDGQWIGSSLADLAPMLDRLAARRVVLVLDRGAARASGAEGPLLDMLAPALAAVFDDFTPNPACDQPLRASRAAVDAGADAFVALGGGSCMDVAKVAALAAGAPDRAAGLVRGAPAADVTPLPVVAIPTTSGTGSETTHFSAIYVEGRKISAAHPGMRPRGVILDVELHMAMPRAIAAATGLDALAQATESFWSVAGTEHSRAHAREAQAAIMPHLVASVLTGGRAPREAMMLGAHRAGRAINLSKTTAAHALSYELTTRFGIPHGLAVALTLGHVAAFNAGVTAEDCASPAGPEHARRLVAEACAGCNAAPEEMPDRIRDLLRTLGLPHTLAAAGVPRDALPAMAQAADAVRLSNNPRRLTTAHALGILERAF